MLKKKQKEEFQPFSEDGKTYFFSIKLDFWRLFSSHWHGYYNRRGSDAKHSGIRNIRFTSTTCLELDLFDNW